MLKALLEKRDALAAQMKAMIEASEAEGRDFTAEEVAQYDELKAQRDAVIRRTERIAEMEAETAALAVVRPAAARAVGPARAPGPPAVRTFGSLGEWMAAVRFHPNDQRLEFRESAGAMVIDNATGEMVAADTMRMDDGPSGGFAVPVQFRDQLLRLTPQEAIIRPRATVIPAGSPPDAAITMPALDQTGTAPQNWFGGVQVQWIAEGAAKPQTDAKLREVTLTPHEVAGTVIVTDKLLRNWTAASSLLGELLRGAVSQAEDYAFLQGTGAGQPLGILKSGALYKVNRAVANTIAYNDVAEMVARGYGPGVFVYSRSAMAYLLKLKDGNGQPMWVPSMREGEPSTLMGRPAILSDRNPLLGTLGDIWYADLKQYLIKDGSGPFVAASEHVYFASNKTVIKIFWNVDGSPWLTAPITLENSYQVSPFVALDVP